MSNCVFCKQKVRGFFGFLKSKHPECETAFNAGKEEVADFSFRSALSGAVVASVQEKINAIAESHYLTPKDVTEALVKGWESALDKALEDSVLSEQEEKNLRFFASHLSLSQDQLDVNGAYTRAAMNGVLREVLEGSIPTRVKLDGQLPFNFQKGEYLVWLFKNVKFFEEKIKRSYEGSYAGVSIRVAKGVYYRTGGFRGHPVQTAYMAHIINTANR